MLRDVLPNFNDLSENVETEYWHLITILKVLNKANKVKKLLDIILENVKRHGDDFYTNDMYIDAEKKIQLVEKRKTAT